MIAKVTGYETIRVLSHYLSKEQVISLLKNLLTIKGNKSYTMSIKYILKAVKKISYKEWDILDEEGFGVEESFKL